MQNVSATKYILFMLVIGLVIALVNILVNLLLESLSISMPRGLVGGAITGASLVFVVFTINKAIKGGSCKWLLKS